MVEGRDELGACLTVAYTLSVFCEPVEGLEAVVNDVLDGVRGGSDAVVYRVEGVGVVAPESRGALPGGLDPLSGVNSEISEVRQTPYAMELYADGSGDLALLASENDAPGRFNRDL